MYFFIQGYARYIDIDIYLVLNLNRRGEEGVPGEDASARGEAAGGGQGGGHAEIAGQLK